MGDRPFEQFGRRVVSGEARSPVAGVLRAGLRVLEPFYAGVMRLRNRLYDTGIFRSHDLSRPTISVGNITTGGTGKTPVVEWLARRLRGAGRHPAVLLRGYRSGPGGSDEAALLDQSLNADGAAPAVVVLANPNRVMGAEQAIGRDASIDVFVLDDAFQHRRARRSFDLVLIDAFCPFGHEHVLPRGLLREPLAGLQRAHAMLITRSNQTNDVHLGEIEQALRRHNRNAPIYRASHVHVGLRAPNARELLPISELRSRRFFALAGIGNPAAFHAQLGGFGNTYLGQRWFADHHDYTADDVARVRQEATAAGAEVIVTTEKDWMKLARLDAATSGEPGLWRLAMEIRFAPGDEERLFGQILKTITVGSPAKSPESS
ncbi:MAG: tetraacyldisaccharide 4'-kinase [Tepidisphaeraceae bacterium]